MKSLQQLLSTQQDGLKTEKGFAGMSELVMAAGVGTLLIMASGAALQSTGTLIKQSDAAGVKLEGAEPEVLAVIERLVRTGIPVMGHLGLLPQAVHSLGYRRQAKDPRSQERLLLQASELESAGCFAMVLEHVPSEIAGQVRRHLAIPVIGIGAGDDCDGQVSVTADLLGLTRTQPPFSQARMDGRGLGIKALSSWLDDQRQQSPPPTNPPAPPEQNC